MNVDVARLRALLERGTPSYEGPPRAHDILVDIDVRQVRMWLVDGRYATPTDADRELLCEALAHLPALLDEVERLRRLCGELVGEETLHQDGKLTGEIAKARAEEEGDREPTLTCEEIAELRRLWREHLIGEWRSADAAKVTLWERVPDLLATAELRNRAEAKLDLLWKALGQDETWPLRDVLAALKSATRHLLDDHDCDCQGHEMRSDCTRRAASYVARLEHAMREVLDGKEP